MAGLSDESVFDGDTDKTSHSEIDTVSDSASEQVPAADDFDNVLADVLEKPKLPQSVTW